MICPQCQGESPDDSQFCESCGERMSALCPGCGAALSPGAKFCRACGQRVSQPVPAVAAATPERMPSSFAHGRYLVQRFLGAGGKKRVYLARDTKLDRDVAFALIQSDGLDATGRERIVREAQAMGRLGAHAQVVTIHDIGDEDGQPYIVTEYMAGGDVEHAIADGGALPLARTLEIAKGVCRALEFAHEQSIVHRDLKPGNVWLTADGTAKIGDFGLAVSLDRSRLTQHGLMVGTVSYMPPEQALGGEATAQADLYSLGAMLYEMVTGRPPFVGDDPTAVISQHINTPPVAPSWHTEHCPPDLEELILRLLAKDPGERPASAADVLAHLELVDPAQRSASHEGAGENPLERLARGVFVGRQQELERLRKAFDGAFSGRGSMVMLVGEPGIGKTRAAQELETYARLRGAQVLWGRAHESSGAPAYWPWIQLGNSYGSTHDVTELAPDMQGKGVELSRIFPWLLQQGGAEPEQLSDPEAAQFRLFDAYATFVRAMSLRTPLLIALDDLHWADKPSLLLLEHVARELSHMRVLIVCTYRDTDLSRTHPLSEALAVLNRESGFQRVAMRGLSREEVAGYIQAAANVTPRRELLDRIYEETEGNPFFLSEVVNLLTQEGKLTKDSVSDIAVPDGVREALGRRLDRVSEETNELLQMAAVVGREFTYDMLTLLGERHEDELLRLIEEALDARVVEEMEQAGRYRFKHALMQETLLDELSTTRRVRLHGSVGEALERRWGARADERAPRLALHFVEAAMLSPRHAAKAVRYSKLAAQQAEAQFAWEVAARHYEHCLTPVSEAEDALGEDEAALLMSLGVCARMNGEYRKAWRSLMRAITICKERGDAAGMAQATLEAFVIDTPPQRHLALVREALEAVGDLDPYLEARLQGCLVNPILANLLDAEAATRAHRRAAELAEAHGFEDVEGQITLAACMRAFFAGEFEESNTLGREAHQRLARLGRAVDAAAALFQCVTAVQLLGQLDECLELASEGLSYARAHHIRMWEEIFADVIASILLARCDFHTFDAQVEERAADSGYLIAAFRASRAEIAGDLGRAVELLPDPAIAGGQPVYLGQLLAFRVRILFNAGHERQAAHEFAAMCAAMRNNPVAQVIEGIPMSGPIVGPLDEALVPLADDAFLRAVMGMRWRPQFDIGSRATRRIRGAIALHQGDGDEAERFFLECLEFCERERLPIEAGRCLQGLAEVAERRGDRAEALALLDRAAAPFRQHGAKLYLDRVIATKVRLQGITSTSARSSIGLVAAEVQSERPEISLHAAPDGRVTLMFSDIEDSTAINERLGDERWVALLREHNALVTEQTRAHDGAIVKHRGDGYMLAFAEPLVALRCGIALQRAFAERNAARPEERIGVRIGLHTGAPVREGRDFFGLDVTCAARIADDIARGGEIVVSQPTREQLGDGDDVHFDAGREVELKGLSGRQTVYSVGWNLTP